MTEKETAPGTPSDAVLSSQELQKSHALLVQTNNQLLQYAHIASHDLQEPLRKIQLYASVLQQRDTIMESDKEMIEKIMKSSARMRLLIDDLMAHAKVSQSGKMARPVDLNHLLDKILDDFELTIKDTAASIRVDKLPVVNAFALEMNQLFYNLIENALKFSEPSRSPEITIWCKEIQASDVSKYILTPQQGKTYYDITVRDNGIGFDAHYSEHIFMVFRKLHPKDVYPGSGIGLFLCRTIVTNHGGVLFVESKPGEGSTFHIIIPQ